MSKFTEMGKKPRKSRKLIGKILLILYCLPILLNLFIAAYYKITSEVPPTRYGMYYFLIDLLPYFFGCFLVLFLIIRTFQYIKAFFKRISFLRNLKNVCNEKVYKLVKNRNPYLSIILHRKDPELFVYTNEKIYAVYFFTSLRKSCTLKIYDENYAELLYYVFKFVPPVIIRREYCLSDVKMENNDLPIEKIMLINPIPHQIRRATDKGSMLVDNNEVMFGYTLFAGTGFCNMLDRLTLQSTPEIKIRRYNYN